MHLLHLTGSMASRAGGTAEAVLRIAEASAELGSSYEIASLDDPNAGDDEMISANVHPLGPGKLGTYAYAPHARTWLDQSIHRFDALIIHGIWQYHGLAASRACRRHKVPYFVYPHGMLDPWFNRTYPLKRLKKQLYWPLFEHPVLQHARALLFTCEEECLLARQSFRPYTVKEEIVGLGTQAPPESRESLIQAFRQELPEWGKRGYLLFMGRIQEKKGLDLLLEAYEILDTEGESLPDLVIAGPIQQKDYAARLKERYPLPRVHWVGSLRGELKWQALATAEALVLPSHQENFGIVVAEALSVGTPTLITDKVNIWREVSQNGAGLVADDSLDAQVALLRKWLRTDPETRKKMKFSALDCFNKTFDIRASTQRLLDCVQRSIHA